MEVTIHDTTQANPPVSHSPIPKIATLPSKVKQPRYLKGASVKILTHPVDKNIAWSFLLSVIFASIAIITGLPLVICLTVILTWALAFRKLGISCCLTRYRCSSGDGSASSSFQNAFCVPTRMVSPTEVFWLHDTSFNLHIAHCLFFLDPGLEPTKLRDLIWLRVLNQVTETGQRAFPRLLRKLVPVCCGYSWIDDENFSMDNHVFRECADVATNEELECHLMNLMSQPLPMDRPLWEIRVIPDFGRGKDTVLILRVHHSVSDAISFVNILGNCLTDNEQFIRLKPRFGSNTFFLNLLRTIVVGPLTFLGWVFCTRRDYNFLNRRHKPGRRVIAWSKLIRFSKVNRIKQVMRCTLNDVFVSITSGAIRSIFRKNGIRNPPNVTLSLPVDLRFDLDDAGTPELGARYACVNVRLPCNTEGAIPRLWEVRHKMEELKTSPDPVVMYGAMHYLIPLLPEGLSHWLLSAVCKKATVMLANIPGPKELLSLDNKNIKRIICFMAVQTEVPVAFSVISYGGSIQISVSADSAVVPQPQELIREVMIELGRLSHLLARRRIPGEHRRKSNFTAERRQEEIIKPPFQELRQKLHSVQDEIHEITLKLDDIHLFEEAKSKPENRELIESGIHRLQELREEFSELIAEIRRRKSLADGIVIVDIEDDLDGELRRPRKRAQSSVGRRASLATLFTSTSSSRPLRSPTSLQHAFVVSTPNLEASSRSPTSSTHRTSFLQIAQDRFGRRKSDFN